MHESIAQNGFTVVKSVFDTDTVSSAIQQVETALASSDAAITGRSGNIAAARNILTDLPEANGLWRHPRLLELLTSILGDEFVCVRALYFDKHPENTWSLPWHKDMTIAVKDNSIASKHKLTFTIWRHLFTRRVRTSDNFQRAVLIGYVVQMDSQRQHVVENIGGGLQMRDT